MGQSSTLVLSTRFFSRTKKKKMVLKNAHNQLACEIMNGQSCFVLCSSKTLISSVAIGILILQAGVNISRTWPNL